VAFPFGSRPFRQDKHSLFAALWRSVFKQHWEWLFVAAFTVLALFFLTQWSLQIPRAFMAEEISAALATTSKRDSIAFALSPLLLGPVFFLPLGIFGRGFLEMATAAWNDKKPSFNALFNFKAGFKAACAYFLAHLPAHLLVCAYLYVDVPLWTKTSPLPGMELFVFLFFAVPLYWLLPLELVLLPLAAEPEIGIIKAIRQSWERGRRRRMHIAGPLFLLGLLYVYFDSFSLVSFFMFREIATVEHAVFLVVYVGVVVLILFPMVAFLLTFMAGYWKALESAQQKQLANRP